MSRSKGLPYFFNRDTHESLWEKPDGLTDEDVSSLPGAELVQGLPPNPTSNQRPERIRASHLLIKHSGSRRPSSWKEVCSSLFPRALLLTNGDHRPTSHVPRMRLFRYSKGSNRTSTATQTNLLNWQRSTQTALHTFMAATLVGLVLG